MSTKHASDDFASEYQEMEDVELHRANSIVNTEIEIIKNENFEIKNKSAILYIGNKTRNFCSEVQYMKVEVVLFMYMFSYVVKSITSTTMIIEKVCLVHMEKSDYECSHLSENEALKEAVEKMANNYHLAHSLISVAPSVVISVFVGAWSDKYSRKIPMIFALAGAIIDGLGSTIIAYYLKSRIEYYFIPATFLGFSGGFITIFMVLYSYASEISTYSNRTMKYAIMEMSYILSMPLGALAGGWMFRYFGYVPVFLTSTCGQIIGLFWVIFLLEETRGLDNKDSWKEKIRNFWSLESLTGSFRAAIKYRPNRGREQIWWLLVALSITIFGLASTAGIGFVYVYHRFNWDNTTYSTVSAIFSIIGVVVMLIVVPLCKKYNVGDAALGIIGSISMMVKGIGIGLAYKPSIYYIALFCGLLGSLSSLAGRSRISKVVSKEDLGKVFAFVTTAETIVPIAATVAVIQGYNASLSTFPGLMFVLIGALIIIPVMVFVWLALLPHVNYEEMSNEKESYEEIGPNASSVKITNEPSKRVT